MVKYRRRTSVQNFAGWKREWKKYQSRFAQPCVKEKSERAKCLTQFILRERNDLTDWSKPVARKVGWAMKLQRFRSSRSIQIGIIEMLDPSGKEFRYFPRQREGKGARGEGKMHGNLVKYQRSSTLEATRAFRSSHLCVESDILRLSRVSTKAIIKMNIYLFSGVNDNLIRK